MRTSDLKKRRVSPFNPCFFSEEFWCFYFTPAVEAPWCVNAQHALRRLFRPATQWSRPSSKITFLMATTSSDVRKFLQFKSSQIQKLLRLQRPELPISSKISTVLVLCSPSRRESYGSISKSACRVQGNVLSIPSPDSIISAPRGP